jgi:hypothetical protein
MNPTKLSGPRPPAAFLAANCDIKLKVVEAASSLLAVADHKESSSRLRIYMPDVSLASRFI